MEDTSVNSPKIEIIRCDRKSVSMRMTEDGTLIIRAPLRMTQKDILAFIQKNRPWIEKQTVCMNQLRKAHDALDEQKLIELARTTLPDKVEKYAELMGVKPAYIKLTGAQKRFGSCNGKNGICFSYFLMAYPDDAVDYVVVHELAHILHHNHSAAFYAEIARILPDYRRREALLRRLPENQYSD